MSRWLMRKELNWDHIGQWFIVFFTLVIGDETVVSSVKYTDSDTSAVAAPGITAVYFCIWNWSHIATHLVLLLLMFLLLGRPLQRSLRLRHFKLVRGEILQDCSSSKYALIDRVRFLICCHTFKMASSYDVIGSYALQFLIIIRTCNFSSIIGELLQVKSNCWSLT